MSSILLLLSAFLHAAWSTSAKVAKDKDAFIFLTIAFACCLIGLLLAIGEKDLVLGGQRGFTLAISAGIFEGAYLVAMAKAFARSTLARAYAILRGGAMVAVWLVSLSLGLESFNSYSFAGGLMVLGGIAFSGRVSAKEQRAAEDWFWPIAGALCIAAYHLCYGESLREGAEPKALFLISLLTSLPIIYLPLRRSFWWRARCTVTDAWGKLLVATLCATFGFVFFLEGLRSSGPAYALSLRNSSIFFSLGFSLWIRDPVTKHQFYGALTVGLGAILLSVARG